MPELPDLEYVVGRLREEVVGRRIERVAVARAGVLQLPAHLFAERLTGQTLAAVERAGHFVRWDVGPAQQLVLHLMLAGRFQLAPAGAPPHPDACWALALEGGAELRYLDDLAMGRAWLIARGDDAAVPGLAGLGVPVLSEAFTAEHFRATIAGRRDMVRNLLLDKESLASIGNCYADEILFDARLHPQTRCTALTPAEVDRLHGSIGAVLRRAVAEVARRRPPLEVKLRDFVQVRKRAGRPCPRCATRLEKVKSGASEAHFCPACQPRR